MRPQATFSFFIFLQLFHFFTLLIAPSSTSFLPPCPSFLLVPPSSSSLLPHRPSFLLDPLSSSSLFLLRSALSKSFENPKHPFFTKFDESATDGPTNQPTNQRTDKPSYRDARTHLKTKNCNKGNRTKLLNFQIVQKTPKWSGEGNSKIFPWVIMS